MAVKSKVKTRGGDKLEKHLKKLQKVVKQPSVVAIGIPRDATPYPDGTSTVMVGTVNEFGSVDGTIPERSYLRTGTRKAQKKITKTNRFALAKRVLDGSLKSVKALEIIGQIAEAEVKQQIVNISQPANAPSTLKAKAPKSSPLIETGHLRQSIRYVVNPNELN